MHPNLKVPALTAVAMAALRLLLYYGVPGFEMQEPMWVFAALTAYPGLSIYAIWPRGSRNGLLSYMKAAFRTNGLYSILLVAFLYMYFAWVNPSYFPNTHEVIVQRELAADSSLDPATVLARVQEFFSLRNFITMILLLCMAMSGFYSLLFAALRSAIVDRRPRSGRAAS